MGERLGAQLFARTTRRVRLTDIGRAHLADTRHVLAQVQAADAAAAGAALNPVGLLRITCSNEFGRIYAMPILTAFLDTYPDVTADVVMVDRVVNMVEERFDIAVRIGPLPSSGPSAVRVGQVRRIVCGAPTYFAQHGIPRSPSDLAEHRIISALPVNPLADWRFGRDLQGSLRVKPRLTVRSIGGASGLGACARAVLSGRPSLRAGDLQSVMEAHEPEPLPIHLVHVEGRRAPVKVRAFIDFAKHRLRATAVLN
ncbi:MAG: LysR family transcriptional regulator [Pseudomonadota bacterium]